MAVDLLDKRVLVLIGVALLALGVGATMMRRAGEIWKPSFSESDLQVLEGKLQAFDVEDLGGLSGSASSLNFGEQELDQIGLKIDGLSFEDLGGLTSP